MILNKMALALRAVTVRRIVYFLVFILALAIAMPANAAGSQIKVTGNVNVRSGPGTTYTKLGQLSKDQTVTATGAATTAGWIQIEYQDGIAYVSSTYVASTSSTPLSGTTASGQARATSVVNIRSGPGTDSLIVGQLKKGDTVPYASTSNGWAQIEYQDGVAYVSSQYITVLSEGGSSGSSGAAQMQATANVNVRTGPGTNYTKLGQLKKGERIVNNGTSNGWVKTDYNGKTAYVIDDFLAPIITAPVITTPVVTDPVVNTSSKVFAIRSTTVRLDANLGSGVLGYLDPGHELTLLQENGAWYKVQFGSQTGYVPSADMQKGNAGDAMAAVNQFRSVSASTPYYQSASINTRLGTLEKGDYVYVLEANSIWAKCAIVTQTVYIPVAQLNSVTGTNNMTAVNATRYTLYSGTPYYTSISATSPAGSLNKDVYVYVVSANDTWAQCTVDSRTVYIQLIHLSGGVTDPGMASVNETRYTQYNSVPYFSTPTDVGSALGTLPKNMPVQVVAASSAWVKGIVNSQTIYIQALYLTAGADITGGTMSTINANRYTLYNSVMYFSTTNTSSQYMLGAISSKNQAVYVQAANATWCKCTVGTQTVYIQASDLTGNDTSLYNMTAVNAYRYAKYDAVKCYRAPQAITSEYDGYLDKYERIYVLAANDTWAQFKIDNKTLYVPLSDLTA